MNTYYLRCRQSQYPTLVDRGVRMGAIVLVDGAVQPVGIGIWDYVGIKHVEGEVEPSGGAADPYIHVNFRTEKDLGALAALAAETDSDIAAGLAEIAAYFIVDAEGRPAAPQFPIRVFL